jgi:hypothetical protein
MCNAVQFLPVLMRQAERFSVIIVAFLQQNQANTSIYLFAGASFVSHDMRFPYGTMFACTCLRIKPHRFRLGQL